MGTQFQKCKGKEAALKKLWYTPEELDDIMEQVTRISQTEKQEADFNGKHRGLEQYFLPDKGEARQYATWDLVLDVQNREWDYAMEHGECPAEQSLANVYGKYSKQAGLEARARAIKDKDAVQKYMKKTRAEFPKQSKAKSRKITYVSPKTVKKKKKKISRKTKSTDVDVDIAAPSVAASTTNSSVNTRSVRTENNTHNLLEPCTPRTKGKKIKKLKQLVTPATPSTVATSLSYSNSTISDHNKSNQAAEDSNHTSLEEKTTANGPSSTTKRKKIMFRRRNTNDLVDDSITRIQQQVHDDGLSVRSAATHMVTLQEEHNQSSNDIPKSPVLPPEKKKKKKKKRGL